MIILGIDEEVQARPVTRLRFTHIFVTGLFSSCGRDMPGLGRMQLPSCSGVEAIGRCAKMMLRLSCWPTLCQFNSLQFIATLLLRAAVKDVSVKCGYWLVKLLWPLEAGPEATQPMVVGYFSFILKKKSYIESIE